MTDCDRCDLCEHCTAVENRPMVIVKSATDGRVLECDAAFASLLGKRVDEMIGQTSFDVWPTEVAHANAMHDEETIFTNEPKSRYMVWPTKEDPNSLWYVTRNFSVWKNQPVVLVVACNVTKAVTYSSRKFLDVVKRMAYGAAGRAMIHSFMLAAFLDYTNIVDLGLI